MDKTNSARLLEEYDRVLSSNQTFCRSMERVVADVLEGARHRVHSVTSRVKDRQKFERKINRLGKHYKVLSEITDIVGVRITTYFEDEIDAIGKLIESEFKIDPENSIDKRTSLDPDRFGYLSLHYICQLGDDRLAHIENRRFSGLKFEIQVRSILQHAWAEIEHDLGYKAGIAIPAPIRRRFSRIAGLLEVADGEFTRLRQDIAAYTAQVESELGKADENLELDQVSLEKFIASEPLVQKLDQRMVAAVPGSSLNTDEMISVGYVAEMLKSTDIDLIGDLRRHLRDNSDKILEQYKVLSEKLENDLVHSTVFQGISVFGLALIAFVERATSVDGLLQTLSKWIIESGDDRAVMAQELWKLKSKWQ